jgi:hypothetical protein
MRQAMTEWTGAWEGWRVDVHEYIDAEDGRVLIVWTEAAAARAVARRCGKRTRL